MKPLYIMWTEGVDEDEARLAIGAAQEVFKVLYGVCHKRGFTPFPITIRAYGTWVVPSLRRGTPYWGTRWYVDNSYSPLSKQVIGPKFLEIIRQEPWQRSGPHYDMAIIEQDLAAEEIISPSAGEKPFILSYVLPGVGAVLSVLRLRFVLNEERRFLALRRLVAHNLGHVIGAPSKSRETNVEVSFGERHCTNVCLMRHTSGVEELVRLAAKEWEGNISFCEECQEDLLNGFLSANLCLN